MCEVKFASGFCCKVRTLKEVKQQPKQQARCTETVSEFLILIGTMRIQTLTKSPMPQARPYKYTIPLATIQSTTVPVFTPDLHHSTGYEPINLSEPLCYSAGNICRRRFIRKESRRKADLYTPRMSEVFLSSILPPPALTYIINDKAHVTNGNLQRRHHFKS
jgi:hypothetical protein